MPGPQELFHVDGCDVLLVGTIPGFVPEADRVRTAVRDHQPEAIALGVPPEDVANLEALVADPTLADGLEPDEVDAQLLEALGHWGETRAVPSPDLEAAMTAELPIVGVDMDDATHSQRFTELVKVRHLVQRGSARKKASRLTQDDAEDAHDLVVQWDAILRSVAPLDLLETEREAALAAAIREACTGKARLLAVVHVARFAGVATRLKE